MEPVVWNPPTGKGLRRDPAAIRKVYDFSDLRGESLTQAAKRRLISGARIVKNNGNIGLELGHFVVKGDMGLKSFACKNFSKIVLTFEGDGYSTGDHKPTMTTEDVCVVGADINTVQPIWIPFSKVISEPAADGEVQLHGHTAKLNFTHISGEWPKTWKLIGIRLVNPELPSENISVDEKEIGLLTGKPIVLEY